MDEGPGPAQRENIESAEDVSSAVIPDQQSKKATPMLLISMAGKTFAIAIDCVCEIADFDRLTCVPAVPRFFAGVTAVRGELVAVIDLALLCEDQPTDLHAVNRLVVLGARYPEFALFAEGAEDLRDIDEQGLNPAPNPFDNVIFVRGATADGLIVLNGGALLNDRRLYA